MFKGTGYSGVLYGFRLSLEVAGLRPTTIKNYVTDTRKFLEYYFPMPPHGIQTIHIREYLSFSKTRVSSKTVYEIQLALRKFFRFLLEDGEISINPCEGIKLTRYKTEPQPMYSLEDIKKLLSSCDIKTQNGVRDYAIINVLFDTGMRVGELISMSLPDWKNKLVKVDGKTGVRFVPLGLSSLQVLERYMRKWNVSVEPLWQGKYGALTASGVLQMIERICHRSNVNCLGVHAFRRSSAAHMKRIGMNDTDIMEIMGWNNITMLRRYISSVSFELAQSAHKKFSPADTIIKR